MATLLLIVACVLTIVVFAKKRSLENQGRKKEVSYFFLKSSLEFLVPFSLVLLFYVALLATISLAWQSVSLQSLIRLEQILTTIRSYTKFNLSRLAVFGLFLGIYLLGVLGIPLVARRKMYSGIEQFSKWTRRVYVFFVFLCSFTILGTQLGPPTNDLRLRIKLTRDGYAELREETHAALSEAVAFQIHTKTRDSLPPAYQTALKRPEEIGKQASYLRTYYASAQSEHGVQSSKAESVLTKIETRRQSNLQTEIRLPDQAGAKTTSAAEPDLGRISYQKVSEANTAVKNYRQKTRERFISFLSTEEGKKLTVQGAKIVTGMLKSELFSPWIKAHPIVEPFIDVFSKTLDEINKVKLETFVDNLAHSIIETPGSADTAINDGSVKIADQTEIKISPDMMQKADQLGRELDQELANLEAAKKEIDYGIQQAKDTRVEKLISELQSSDKSVRETAAQRLSETADISEAKVNKLINIMRHGNQKWVTSRTRNEGHHCTDYEYTSVRYYAATALANVKSPHVNSEVVREARKCQSDSITTRTVTDPGWI